MNIEFKLMEANTFQEYAEAKRKGDDGEGNEYESISDFWKKELDT